MLEIGKSANDEFVSRNLGPRMPFDLYVNEGEPDPNANDVERWKSAHALGEGPNPRGKPDFDAAGLQKLIESHRTPYEETRKQWEARIDRRAEQVHEAAIGNDEIDPPRWPGERAAEPEQSWADKRIAEGYSVPVPAGGFIARSVPIVKAKLLAKLQSGLSRESAVAELSEEHSEIIVKISAAMLNGKTFEQAKALVEV